MKTDTQKKRDQHRMHRVLLAFATLISIVMGPLAEARSTGIIGATNRDGGSGCATSCHSGTTSGTVAVTIGGPTSLAAGQTGNYTVTNNSSLSVAGRAAGVNIATGDGTLSPAGNLASNGATELYHFTPNSTDANGDTVFSFSWTMPAAAGTGTGHTMYAVGRVWYSGNWSHATNFGITTAAPFTALVNGLAAPGPMGAGSTGTLSTSGGAGSGAVTYTPSNSGICSVSGTTVTAVSIGTCTITANKAADSSTSARSDAVSFSIVQGTQTIIFAALSPKLTSDPPFTVSATGGGSGNPVTFTAAGVCSSSGTNGSTITLTGAAGTCTVTADQTGNANYLAAPTVVQAFAVVAPGEVFPPDCQVPAGWAQDPGFPSQNWSVASDFASQGACSFKSNPLPGAAGAQYALYAYTGNFQAGTISLSVKVSSFTGPACFLFAIDQSYQNIGSGCTIGAPGLTGELPFQVVNIPVTAGTHKIWILYYRANNLSIAGSDAAWLDEFTMPLLTAITSSLSASVTVGAPFSYQIVADNFPQTYASTALPPGLTLNASTGLISGTPTVPGVYPVTVTVSNPGGVAPMATDSKVVTITVNQIVQTITFGPINNRLTSAPPITVSASGGASGNPVTFGASGVCTASGTDGTTITLTGVAGTCAVTANQPGNANYADATPVVQSFTVTAAANELFPPACGALPAGWSVPVAATSGWSAEANFTSTTGGCSLRSNDISDSQNAQIQYVGTFANGTVDFKYRVSSEATWDCLQFFIDGAVQTIGGTCPSVGLIGNSGESGWVSVSFPITLGAHTLLWKYSKDSSVSTINDAAWIDDVVFPQYTLSVSRNGTGTGTVFSEPSGIVCGGSCSASLSGSVSLTAFANPGSYLTAWSGGGCMGSGACIVSLSGNTTVTATFSLIAPPGPPQMVAATPEAGQTTINFVAPASDGGGPISLYAATCTASGQTTRTGNAGTSPIVVTSMVNGIQYSCTVTATNSAGPGTPSAASLVTPRTVPDAPTAPVATAGNAQATIAVTAPAFNGGTGITAYTATCTASGQTTRTGTSATTSINVTSMVNGIQYACSVVATNAAGDGAASSSVNVTPRTVAGAPTGFTATPRDARIVFAFVAPASDGGSAITGYTVSCNGATVTGTGADSPITIGGLMNAGMYSCNVVANNAAGPGAPSLSASAVPGVPPGATLWTQICTACHTATPSGVQLNGAGSTATVMNYVITNQPLMAATPLVTTLTAAERVAVATYIAAQLPAAPQVTAFNTQKIIDVGTQISTVTSNPLSISFQVIEVVTAPTHGTLSAFTGTSITYTPAAGYTGSDSFTFRGKRTTPASLLGDARTINITVSPPPLPVITSPGTATGTNGVAFSYQITATNGPTGFGASGLPTPLLVNPATGLISGTPNVGGTFNATITASNANPGSPVSAALTITLNPAAQTITFPAQTPATRAFSASPGNTFAILPIATSTSGLAVTYVTKTPAVCSVAGTTVTMLTAGTCTIGANQAGNANFTIATEVTRSVTITPILPGAPTIGVATPGNNQATVAFTAPTNTGGTAITLYTANCTPSGSGTNTVSPIVVGSLSNGTTYTCSVRATNSVGLGPASGTVMVTPAPTPTPPLITSVNNATFTVNAPGSFSVTATGTPAVFTYSATGTPPTGVTFSTTTGVLSGTPTQAGAFPLTLGVANGVLPNASQSFTLSVSKANQTITFNNPGTRSVSPSAFALSAVATSSLGVTFISDTPAVCTVAAANATMIGVGTCTLRAQQAGNANFNAAVDVPQSFSVLQGSQTITFPAQVPASRAFVASSSFALSSPATSSAPLTVAHTSLTTGVCTIAGTTVTIERAGICTIAANQSGSANYSAAAQVTQSITFTGSAPGAPVIGTATPGATKITVSFTAPASDGGFAITGYTATCGAAPPQGGSASPITVTGLTNGVSYSCSVTATNSAGTSVASGSVMATPNALPGAAVWSSTCGNVGCHNVPGTPAGTRLNVGGSSSAVLDYVVSLMSPTVGAMNFIVGTLSPQQKIDVAAYIQDFIPAVNATTPFNTAVPINVASQIFLNSPLAALTSLQVVTPPANGTLSAFTGTNVTYTPNPGFVGTNTFTYRGTQAGVSTDVRTVTVTVQPAAPVITSALTANGIINQAFNYQIAATNSPTSYAATGLPAGLIFDTNTGLISGAPSGAGVTPVTISATASGVTGSATLTITVNLIPQAITFGAQVSPRTFSQAGVVTLSPLATGGASGNPIVYSSSTPAVCSTSGATFTMLSAGICTIAANQAGNATYAAAAAVTQSVSITGIAPAAPTIGTAVAGNTQATINFTPPTNTGGLPIISYTANCNGVTVSGPSSPIVLSGLTNGTPYSCSVQATNLAGTSVASGSVMVTPVAIAFTNVVYSRKTHAAAGDKDLAVNAAALINGAITVEPRAIGAGHRILFRFNNPVSSVTSLAVVDAGMNPVGSASPSFSGNDLIVTLTGIPDNKRVTVTATGVNNALTVSASIGFLEGDVTNSKSVNAADISAVKSRVGQPVATGNNFLFDLDASGVINNTDVSAVKARSGLVIP
ncbi:MAG: putative Ig domain-containing protein [Betaproteobacteria bacterium]